MIILSPNIPHHDVDKGVLYEGEEDKEGAGGHEHVDCLDKIVTLYIEYILNKYSFIFILTGEQNMSIAWFKLLHYILNKKKLYSDQI